MAKKILNLSDPEQDNRTGAADRRTNDRRTGKRAKVATEKLTYEEAQAKMPDALIWPIGPVHGIAGLTHNAHWRAMHEQPQIDDQDDQDDEEQVIGPELLLEMVTHERALPLGRAIVQIVLMKHDEHGALTLRMVEHKNGYLIGVLDSHKKAIGGACEFFETGEAAKKAWADWLTLFGMYKH